MYSPAIVYSPANALYQLFSVIIVQSLFFCVGKTKFRWHHGNGNDDLNV